MVDVAAVEFASGAGGVEGVAFGEEVFDGAGAGLVEGVHAAESAIVGAEADGLAGPESEGRPLATPIQAALSRLAYGVADVTVKLAGPVSVTPLARTRLGPVVAPAGILTWMLVLDWLRMVDGVPLQVTTPLLPHSSSALRQFRVRLSTTP